MFDIFRPGYYLRTSRLSIKALHFAVFFLFFYLNTGTVLVYSQQQCLTRQQIADDARCLYIINNKAYEKGSRAAPHQGHPCGSDVSSIVPSFHSSSTATYLSPNYRMDVCTLVPPTTIPTPLITQVQPSISAQPSGNPSPTSAPGVTQMSFTLKLHGIGSGGDNANPASFGNFNPVNWQRQLTIQLFDADNRIAKQAQIPINFSNTTGMYSGTVNLGTPFTAGVYTVKLISPMYLQKRIENIFTITQGQTLTVPTAYLVVGDVNGDNMISVFDYNLMLDCYSDFSPPRACTAAKKATSDFTDDGAVNHLDYNLFLRELSVQAGQ